MNILVTGGAGFIGSAVVKKLVERGDEVVCIDNFNNYYNPKLKEDRVSKFLNGLNFKIYRTDIGDFQKLHQIFKQHQFDKICHLAAQAGVRYSLTHPFVYERTNVLGTLNLLELVKEFKIKDFIYASSSSVYGRNSKIPFSETDNVDKPVSLYAATKKATELIAHTYHHLYGINCIGLRFFTVYGPWGRPDMALFKFTKAILENKPIDVYNFGNMERDFTYIDDIVRGTVAALDSGLKCEIFNLGNNQPVKLDYFISVIEKILGKTAKKNLLPMQLGDVKRTYADITKAKEMLGWQPKIGIEEGIERFVKWYKEYYKI
jgi:UDP-glucuronate 4-epimerase